MIIHFTKEFNNLFSILESKAFLLHYCAEYFSNRKKRVVSRAAHPMVSFSDYEHTELENKEITYGSYGIAMRKKEWALKKGLGPVMYVEHNSPVASGLATLFKARKGKKEPFPQDLNLPIFKIKCFTKHFYGYNSHFSKDNFDFKYENEWRFVPEKKEIDGKLIAMKVSKYEKDKKKYNDQLRAYPLKFSNKDIKYIYVKTELEREEIISKFGLAEEIVCLSNWILSEPKNKSVI